ncbi:hypothetical protein [Hymenobacter sublimis]|uniref:TraR/DksA family transcriptional regulator n=1 Tax=Hymenobacter sublimis TaxID=2933777 RepID=A0ABY4JCM2_9BACT|nr:hypothetical protein [Hymenobacter sublimis]UPL50559.1 hypothetical protein MWH26_06530 [Hymenobacter sublimis]
MASNLDYLDPALQPLADKVQAYIQAEKEFQRAEVEAVATTHQPADAASHTSPQPAASGSAAQPLEQIQLKLQHLREELQQLRQEVVALLPVRDEWVKINLGYGPSRVGAFSTPAINATDATPEYDLRVVV